MSNEFLQQILADIIGDPDITLTPDQEEGLHQFWDFNKSNEQRATYLLTGSAGTGKTFMINIFTQLLRKSGYKVVLLAPTGRAAKVITKRTRRPAYTIHHHIYQVLDTDWGGVQFRRKKNGEKKSVVYVVDEASMIGSDADGSTPHGLLRDLLAYIFDAEEQTHKLMLVGDPVQLPPVGNEFSPALHPNQLIEREDLELWHAHLTEVKRQEVDSGILDNAIYIRDSYLDETGEIPQLTFGRDVQVMDNAYEALETYMGYYQEGNHDRVIFLTYSNYQATRVNQAIRRQLLQTEKKLIPSDLVMVVKNNYAWGDERLLPFIANGEMGTVRYVHEETYEERFGLEWMDAEIEFENTRGGTILIPCKLLLSLLDNKQPQLARDSQQGIWQERRAKYMHLPKTQAREQLRKDPYINALQVKYGYAITGHKAQGGQWENVIIGFEPDYGNNFRAYLRWSYTVLTRAEERVFLLNCPFLS